MSKASPKPTRRSWSTGGVIGAVVVAVAISQAVPLPRLHSLVSALLGDLSLRGAPPSMPPPPRHPTLTSHASGGNATEDMVASKAYNTPCVDHSDHCAAWKQKGECIANSRFMMITCAHSCGTCASTARAPPLPPLPEAVASHANLLDAADAECKDEHADCASWAAAGECGKNAAYMTSSCPVSCRSCEAQRRACERVESSRAIRREPGGLDALFERALADFAAFSPRVLHREPWVVEFDDFVSEDEAAALIAVANDSLVRSLAGDQVSPVRTSNQFWCSTGECLRDEAVRRVTERVANVTGVPSRNMEYFQILRYEPGQFYRSHHDQNSAPWTPQGVRLLTFYIYLNDVQQGGGTSFTDLGIAVQPKRGKAVLWPSVLDAQLERIEPMTHHEALPPVSGTKYGANLWLHQYDFKTPSSNGCKWTSRNTFH
ncbi:hypothetical protein KFE25_008353 [Diacronema lutheri]|uniref:ShKT domain-containing protein n=1 Tax=Diacronema lutheri TaxID=2081491 RepID=A0A8J6CBW9_DIALT|nr:hypothetical protein KFE25_008353 [Diacronema lutheri]